jgi:predicted dehydrogenase
VDTNINASKYLADQYPGAKNFSSVQQMLEHTKPDVLHICTPLDTHVRIAEFAIDAGINLIIEKPITPTAAEAERILKQASSNGILVCAVHQFIFQDGVQKAKKFLSKIGRLIHIQSTICSAGAVGYSEKQSDFIATDILPHPLSLMQYFSPGSIFSKNWTMIRAGYGELRAFCKAEEITLSIFISMNARPTECSLQIIGTNGVLYVDLFNGFAFIESAKVSRMRKIMHPFSHSANMFFTAFVNLGRRVIQRKLAYPGLDKLINSFYNSVQVHCDCPISNNDILAVSIVRDELIQSAGLDKLLEK